MNPEIRRRLSAMALVTERERLERLIAAIVNRAIEAYGGEPIEEAWEHIVALARRLLAAAADRGAFVYFGIRDRGDIVGIQPVLYAGGFAGTIGVDARPAATLILRGGTTRIWLHPRDLEFTAAAR